MVSDRRPGRRPGSGSTRELILDAAREQFAQHGYAGATMRSIAAQAGVDPGLIRHFFRDKDGVFAATLELPPEASDVLSTAIEGPHDVLGERLTRAYLGLWEAPETREQMQTLVRSALTNVEASDRLRELLTTLTRGRTSDIRPDTAGAAFGTAMAHLLGIAFARHLGRIPPLADLDFEEVVARVAPSVQLELTSLS